MAIPDYQSFMLPFLRAISDGKEHTLRELYERLADELTLSDQEREQMLPSGRQRVFHNRIGWARTYLKKAGLLVAVKRGVFRITDKGQELLATSPKEIA